MCCHAERKTELEGCASPGRYRNLERCVTLIRILVFISIVGVPTDIALKGGWPSSSRFRERNLSVEGLELIRLGRPMVRQVADL